MSAKQTLAPLAAVLLAGLLLSACTSNGSAYGPGGGAGGPTGSSSGGPPNDGTGPTNITQGGTPVTGNFICTQGAGAYGDVTTQVGANGLLGSSLTALLNTLGGSDATTLLNSVIDPNNVIDGNLDTYAQYQLALSLFSAGGAIDSVDLSVLMPPGVTVPAGQFAVFGISFPAGTVNASILNDVSVTTYLTVNGVETAQESNTLTESQLSLLGVTAIGQVPIWLGLEVTKPYDAATLALAPSVLSAQVGDAMNAYEFCPGGELVN